MSNVKNEQFPEVIKYLIKKQVFSDVMDISILKTGASGAELYGVTDKNGRFVVKQSNMQLDRNHNILQGYKKEYNFYILMKDFDLDIPKVVYSENSNEYGYILVFPYYRSINYSEWNNNLQLKAMDLIAKLHSIDVEKISKQLNLQYRKVEVNTNQLKTSLDAWTNILESFPDDFDIGQIELIYNSFGDICDVLNSGINCVCHGDFHADNMLLDNNNIILSDWQNISIGSGAGDISFFVSRGKASGLIIDEDELVDHYCKRFYYYSKVNIKKEEIHKMINASNVFTSFMYWAFYLKGADVDRVRGIYEKMLNSFKDLL
jgi:hypothetical protein